MYQHVADAVLMLHVLFVAFVVFGLLFTFVGGCLHWRWIRGRWFRLLHATGIGFVVVQSWLGVVCPLTTLEMWLRERASDAVYNGGFIQYWLQRLLYYEAPSWVFSTVYSLFGLLVVVTWLWFPPQFRKQSAHR